MKQRYNDKQIVLELLLQIRREIPVLSSKVIYHMIKPTLLKHGITIGRDALHELEKATRFTLQAKTKVRQND